MDPPPLPDLENQENAVERQLLDQKELPNQEEIDKAFARQTFDHVRTGLPGDGIIYVNDGGYKVKLDRRGTPYRCDLKGVRNTMRSSRPADMDPEVWKIMGPYRDRIKKKAKKAAKAEPQPQTAPMEGALIKIEVLSKREDPPNAGGGHPLRLQHVILNWPCRPGITQQIVFAFIASHPGAVIQKMTSLP